MTTDEPSSVQEFKGKTSDGNVLLSLAAAVGAMGLVFVPIFPELMGVMLFLVIFLPAALVLGVWGWIKKRQRPTIRFVPGAIEVVLGGRKRVADLSRSTLVLSPPTVGSAAYVAAVAAAAITHHVPRGVRASWLVEVRGPFGQVELLLDHFERSEELLERFRRLTHPEGTATDGSPG